MKNFNKSSTHIYQITTTTCDETGRITASSDDIPGLVMETETIDEIPEIAQDLIPMLLELNNVSDERTEIPVCINHDLTFHIHIGKGGQV